MEVPVVFLKDRCLSIKWQSTTDMRADCIGVKPVPKTLKGIKRCQNLLYGVHWQSWGWQHDGWADASCCSVRAMPKDVHVMNGLVNELEHKWPLVIISLCYGHATWAGPLSPCSVKRIHHFISENSSQPKSSSSFFCFSLKVSPAD